MRRFLVELAVIALASVAAGAAINAVRRDRLPIRLPEAYYQVESKAQPIFLTTAHRLFDGGNAVFLDARPAAAYESSQIEGAFSLPLDRWQEIFPTISSWIVEKPIVVYGSQDGVRDADDLALAIGSRIGFDSIYVYIGGFEEWKNAGLPLRSGPDPNRDVDREGTGWDDETGEKGTVEEEGAAP